MAQPRSGQARYAHSRREAAARIGVSTKKIDRLIAEGRLQAVKLGRTWHISDSSLRALVGESPALESA